MSNYTYTYKDPFDINSSTIYTSTGINGTWSASSMPYTISATGTGASWTQPSAKIQINGEDADISVNGKSLCRAIEAIEQRLGLLRPAPELENEWEELKQLGDRYRTLEADIREKMKVWEQLKKDHG